MLIQVNFVFMNIPIYFFHFSTKNNEHHQQNSPGQKYIENLNGGKRLRNCFWGDS